MVVADAVGHARTLLRALAAGGLGSAVVLDGPVTADVWSAVLRGAVAGRIQPALATAIRDGAWPATPGQRRDALSAHRSAVAHVARAEGVLLSAAAALRQAGLDFRVLKGAAAARLDYRDPTLRVFGDVDLLLPGTALAEGIQVLTGLGAQRTVPPLRKGFDARFAKAVPLRLVNGLEIDLHRSLALEPFGLLVDLERLFCTPEWFAVGDTQFPALNLTHRFLHACYHAVLDRTGRALGPLRDVSTMIQRPDLDDEAVIREALSWHGGVVASTAICRAREFGGVTAERALDVWARGYRPRLRERFALAAFEGPRPRRVQRAVATAWMVPDLHERVDYVAAVLRPSPQFAAHHGGYRRWLRRGLSRP